jgi:hypothetical protein
MVKHKPVKKFGAKSKINFTLSSDAPFLKRLCEYSNKKNADRALRAMVF